MAAKKKPGTVAIGGKPITQSQWQSGALLAALTGQTGPQKGIPGQSTLPPPPPGTYDPGIDYNAQASQRGYGYTANDAQTAFEQGQQDYGLNLANLTTNRDRALQNIHTQEGDVQRGYGILGNQQAEHARQAGVTSGGLLALSQQKRDANQAHDLAPLTQAEQRTGEDFTTGKNQLDLQNARTFGGFNGQVINDPYTGQPVAGSLLTSLSRAGGENTAFQGYSGTLKAQQAAQDGYISPLSQPSDPNAFLKKLLAQR